MMDDSYKVSGARTQCMVLVFTIKRRATVIEVNLLKTENTVTEFSGGAMAANIRATGPKASSTAQASTQSKMKISKNMVSGNMEKWFNGLMKKLYRIKPLKFSNISKIQEAIKCFHRLILIVHSQHQIIFKQILKI